MAQQSRRTLTVSVSSYDGSYKNLIHVISQYTNTWELKTVGLPLDIIDLFRVEFITPAFHQIAIDEIQFSHMSCESGNA